MGDVQPAAFLTDADFGELAQAGAPPVTPFNPSFLSGASIDLRLSNTSYRYKFDGYRLGQEISDSDYVHEQFSELVLAPGDSAFVVLEESLQIPVDCVGIVFPRSSVTRLGLLLPPVFMNPGYVGRMPVTLTNHTRGEVTIVPGVRVAQLALARLSSPPMQSYDAAKASKYVGEEGAPSRLHTDEEISQALERVLERAVPEHLLK